MACSNKSLRMILSKSLCTSP